jgi:hypothetical protein
VVFGRVIYWKRSSGMREKLYCHNLVSEVCQDNEDMMVRKPAKLQSYKIEDLCLILNCTSPCTNPLSQLTLLNIIHRVAARTFHLSYFYWMITSLYENTMSYNTVTVHKLT